MYRLFGVVIVALLGCLGPSDANSSSNVTPTPAQSTAKMLAARENPSCLAIAPDDIVWIGASGNLRSVAKTGGSVRTITHVGSTPPTLIVDQQFVYWSASGALWRIPLSGGVP